MAEPVVPLPSACASARAELELHALDALHPGEAAAVDAHLATCLSCRVERRRLGDVATSLLALGPSAEVPAELAVRLGGTVGPAPTPAPDLVPEGAGADAHAVPADTSHARAPERRRRRSRPRRAAVVVAVAAAAALVVVAVLALRPVPGDGGADDRAGSSVQGPAALVLADGTAVGSAQVDEGDPAVLVVSLDRVVAGVPYVCLVRTDGGALVPVGTWTSGGDGPSSWTVALGADLGVVHEVLITGTGGAVVATAALS